MDNNKLETTLKNERKGERGAALVTVLLISFLLVGAAIGLILSVSMNTANVTDATAEQQAYYAAESGIQSAINVLRENTTPNPLINPSPSPLPTDNQIDYLKAIKIATSNATLPTAGNCASSAPSLDCTARLSRWLSYTGGVVPIGTNSRMSFAVEVSDPDNIGDSVRYSASGYIESQANGPSKTFTAPGNPLRFITITYVPPASPITVSVAGGVSAVTDFGRFVVTGSALGGVDVPMPPRVRFAINVNTLQPYNTVKSIRGFIDPGTIAIGSSGTVRLFYDSQALVVQSSLISLTAPSGVACNADGTGSPGCGVLRENIFLPDPEGYYRSGFSVIPNPPTSIAAPGVTLVTGTITAPEPVRLVIRSTGYGPNGAKKQLEAVIQKNYFNGLSAPSPLTLIGAQCTNAAGSGGCATRPTTSTFNFAPGNSTPIIYSGKDALQRAFLPPVGVTNNPNLAAVNTAVAGMNGSVYGATSNVADELPYWLQTPANLDATVQLLKLTAQASGRYYAPGVTPPNNTGTNYGDYAKGTGITFVDGDLSLRGQGGGILVVTGKLNFNGAFDWKGLVLITGAEGFERSGGGNGILGGTMIVAPYNAQSLSCSPNTLNCFLSPRYEISGGGNSTLQYNSTNVANGLGALSNFVKGVAEK